MNLSELNLDEDFRQVLTLPEAAQWELHYPHGLEIWVTMGPSGQSSERFQARLLWQEYPGEPPSLKFRDPATGRLDIPTSWPIIRGFRPSSLDACVNYCAEGFNLHPEWRNDPRYRWNSGGNVLLKLLRILQDEFNNYYEGRQK